MKYLVQLKILNKNEKSEIFNEFKKNIVLFEKNIFSFKFLKEYLE